MITRIAAGLPLTPNPAPTSVNVPTGTGLLSHINWGVVGACVLVAIFFVAAWHALPKWVVAAIVVILLIAVGVVTVNHHAVGR